MSRSPANPAFMNGLAWALFGVAAAVLAITLVTVGGLFPIARIGVLPIWSALGIIIAGVGALALIHLLVQQKQALQIAGVLLIAGCCAGAAFTELEYTYKGVTALDYFMGWMIVGMLLLFIWRGPKQAGRPAWALIAVVVGGLFIGQGRETGYTYYEPLIIIAEDVSKEHAVLDEFIDRYNDAKEMNIEVDSGIGELYADDDQDAIAMLAEKDRHFYEYGMITGEKATELKKNLEAYEENAKDADPGLREIRNVIVLLQKAQEIFEKEEAFYEAQFQLENAKAERKGREEEDALGAEVARLRSELRNLKQDKIEKAQDLLTSPDAQAIIASGGKLYRAGGKKQRTLPKEGKEGEEGSSEEGESAGEEFVGDEEAPDVGAVDTGIPEDQKWLLDPEPYAFARAAIRASSDIQRALLYIAAFAAAMLYLNGWAQARSRWQPLPLASRFIDGFWGKAPGAVLPSGSDEDLADFLQQLNQKGESWLCFADEAPIVDDVIRRRPEPPFFGFIPLAFIGIILVWQYFSVLGQGAFMFVPSLGVLAAIGVLGWFAWSMATKQRRHIISSDDDFVPDADLLVESTWNGTYLVTITDMAVARDLFMDLLAALRNRQGPRAVAWKTLNIVWAMERTPPQPVVEELLRLASRQNLRLVLVGPAAQLPEVDELEEEDVPTQEELALA